MTAFRRCAPLLLALACLCAEGRAAAQTRDTTSQQVPVTRPPSTQKPPADTPSTQQPSRPSVRLPSVQIPDIRLPAVRPRTVRVPSLAGRSRAEAVEILRGAGLVLGQVSELPVDRPAGTVFLQRPAAGDNVARGSPVSITLAQAQAQTPPPARTARMPDVTGEALGTAVRRIEAAGLRVGMVEGASGPRARVRSQSQPPGEAVRLGTAVNLSMANPPEPAVATAQPPAQQPPKPAVPVDSVAVPDVGKLRLDDARAALASAGLSAEVDASLADSASWLIASQVPAAGTRVAAGGPVALSLAPPPAPAVVAQEAAQQVVEPPAADASTREPVEPVAAEPGPMPLWPWIVIAILLLLATAAMLTRRLRALPRAVAPPVVAVSARVRGDARPQVEVRGAPFAASAPRLRMRTRTGAPALSVAAAGPLFTENGGAGD